MVSPICVFEKQKITAPSKIPTFNNLIKFPDPLCLKLSPKCRLLLHLPRLNPFLDNQREEIRRQNKQKKPNRESEKKTRGQGEMMFRIVQIAFFCFLVAAGISISSVIADSESMNEILQANGLPLGIFPKGVREFNFDAATGRFSVYLNQSCNAKYETELHYDANITGTITKALINDLSGISAQDLFLWFPVKEIRVDVPSSGIIYFDVGVVHKQYSLSVFETPRDCVAVRDVNKVQSSMLPLYQLDHQTLGRDII